MLSTDVHPLVVCVQRSLSLVLSGRAVRMDRGLGAPLFLAFACTRLPRGTLLGETTGVYVTL